MNYVKMKQEMIYWAGLLNQKGLAAARSGNISCRIKEQEVLITGHDSYLVRLSEDEIVLLGGSAGRAAAVAPSSEKDLHLAVYKNFPEASAVIHAHSPCTTAFFHCFDKLDIFSFEAEFYLGSIGVVKQATPTVTDVAPVIAALGNSNIIVLGGHGVVAMGRSLKEAFSLIELLEEQARVNLMLRAAGTVERDRNAGAPPFVQKGGEVYSLLSPAHVGKLVDLANNDACARDLGKKLDLTCTIAVENKDTGHKACFSYVRGEIVSTAGSDNPDYLISAKSDVLRKIFNKEISPFTAATQGRIELRGDLPRMNRWYPVMARIFEVWARARVE